MLRDAVPMTPPYRVWTNFEFMDNHGQWHEIDALVLGRRRLHLIELKAYTGVLQGTEQSWTITSLGAKRRTQRSPLLITRRKAQRLATRIQEEARKVAVENGLDPETVRRALPFIQECVFLHGSPFGVDMPDLAKSSLFGPDDRESDTHLPGISTRILEAPNNERPYGEDMSVIIALALKQLGVTRRAERDAGSWTISGKPTAAGDDWQEWPSVHKATNAPARARVVSLPRGAAPQARAAAHRRMQREFSLLKSLRQESIVAPEDLVQDEDGNTVIIYPDLEGYVPLDLALADHNLSAEQQVELLTHVAEALAYAHRNQVANRGLSPSTVLINVSDLEAGRITIRLADWAWAGRVHSSGSHSSTFLGTREQQAAASDDVYQAPEDRWAAEADRVALDVFSLGALAYFVLTGAEAPARDRADLLERLRQEQGLDLAASEGRFVDERLRALVLRATRPSVTDRVDTDPKSGQPRFGAQEFATELAEYTHDRLSTSVAIDPLNPLPETVIDNRFEVVKVLGAGSTARGILVKDRTNDDCLRVLKVGLDESATSRLHDEAAVLNELCKQRPAVPSVVELVEGPVELSGRTALVLTNCGEQTLSDLIRYDPLTESRLRMWGTELLSVVVALDAAGITHRDIKPANLGLARDTSQGKSAKTHLALFDFSLSRASVAQIDAGTPPYRDPFLGTGTRTAFDSAAERYSAAVVLYEMATASIPVYGDGVSDPRVLRDDVSVAAEDFTAVGLSRTRAEALAGFFRTALTRDAKARFDTAAAMRDAWVAAFKVKPGDAVTAPEPVKRPAPQPVRDPEVETPAPAVVGYSSLRDLAIEFARAAAVKPSALRRQVVEMVLGTHADSPDDPFVTYPRLAEIAGVTSGRIAQIFGEFPSLWAKNQRLAVSVANLYRSGQSIVATDGGASTPALLARELAGVLATAGDADQQRLALGVVRLLMASPPDVGADSEDASAGQSLYMVRRHGAGTVAMIATQAISRRLPAELAIAADTLVAEAVRQGAPLVSRAVADGELRRAAATVLDLAPADVEIPTHALLSIAAVASTEVALSARDELHPVDLAVESALKVVLRGLAVTDHFGRAELESRLTARFPDLSKRLPRRPDLDGLVETVAPGMQWDAGAAEYRFADAPDTGSSIPTHTTFTQTEISRSPGFSNLAQVLESSTRQHNFRAFGVPLGRSDEIAAALVAIFHATHIDVTELLLDDMRRKAQSAGLDWAMILAADAGAPADREGLKGFVSQAIPSLVEAVNTAPGPVVLTDLSTLAAYGQLSVLSTWSDLNTPPPHAVWALVPQPLVAGGGGPRIDGTALPLNSPEQFVMLDESELKSFVSLSKASADDDTESTKERV